MKVQNQQLQNSQQYYNSLHGPHNQQQQNPPKPEENICFDQNSSSDGLVDHQLSFATVEEEEFKRESQIQEKLKQYQNQNQKFQNQRQVENKLDTQTQNQQNKNSSTFSCLENFRQGIQQQQNSGTNTNSEYLQNNFQLRQHPSTLSNTNFLFNNQHSQSNANSGNNLRRNGQMSELEKANLKKELQMLLKKKKEKEQQHQTLSLGQEQRLNEISKLLQQFQNVQLQDISDNYLIRPIEENFNQHHQLNQQSRLFQQQNQSEQIVRLISDEDLREESKIQLVKDEEFNTDNDDKEKDSAFEISQLMKKNKKKFQSDININNEQINKPNNNNDRNSEEERKERVCDKNQNQTPSFRSHFLQSISSSPNHPLHHQHNNRNLEQNFQSYNVSHQSSSEQQSSNESSDHEYVFRSPAFDGILRNIVNRHSPLLRIRDEIDGSHHHFHHHQSQQLGGNLDRFDSAVWEAEIDDDSDNSIQNHHLLHINRNSNILNRNMGPSDQYEQLIVLDDGVVQPVPDHLLQHLPQSKFTEGNKVGFSEENKSCTICMTQYEVDEVYMVLPCLHRFHKECVCEWFKRKNTCPNCKDKVTEHFKREGIDIKPPQNNNNRSILQNGFRIIPFHQQQNDNIPRIQLVHSDSDMDDSEQNVVEFRIRRDNLNVPQLPESWYEDGLPYSVDNSDQQQQLILPRINIIRPQQNENLIGIDYVQSPRILGISSDDVYSNDYFQGNDPYDDSEGDDENEDEVEAETERWV